jgi:hypothetical protein
MYQLYLKKLCMKSVIAQYTIPIFLRVILIQRKQIFHQEKTSQYISTRLPIPPTEVLAASAPSVRGLYFESDFHFLLSPLII